MSGKPIPSLDLMFFLTETPQSPRHVAAVQVFELPHNAPGSFLLDLVESFRRVPAAAPFNYRPHFPRFGMPQWRVDDDMEMSYHVRHSALPTPGTDAQLMEVVQRLHAPVLDRRRPGWMCQVIEGLENNRFAIYTKVHHAYIDGLSGVKRLYGSLSPSPGAKKIVPVWSRLESAPRNSMPADKDRQGKALARQLNGMREVAGFFGDIGMQWLKLRQGKAQIPYAATYTRLNRPLDWDTRSTAVCTFSLDRVKAIGKVQGCTVNEVVLTIIGAALDDYLAHHGEKPASPLVAMCPMSLRQPGDDTASTQVSGVHISLGDQGVKIADRLRQVMDSSRAAKDMVSGLSTEALTDYTITFFALMELLNRSKLDRYLAPSCNVLVSNVPGPGTEKELYLCGARMAASYPISTLLPGVNLNVTLLSHGNKLDFGLMGDMHSLPDLELVVESMLQRFEELQREVLGRKSAVRKTRAKRKPKTEVTAGVRRKPGTNSPASAAKTTARNRPAVRPKSASKPTAPR